MKCRFPRGSAACTLKKEMERKRVLVTGASKGIGAAIARKLAEADWDVALHFGRDTEAAKGVAEALGERLSGTYRFDFVTETDPGDLIDEVLAGGRLDALVNNAGVYAPGAVLDLSPEAFDALLRETMRINVEAPLRLMRAAGAHFRAQGGKVLNVASRVGFKGEPDAAIYAASKAALINLTRSLAVEWAPHGIGVFGIAPGWTQTVMAREGIEARLPEILSGIPLGRMASPDDCAAVAKFLLSEEAAYLSGQVIDVNGASYFH